jgi:protein-L-isoaspartate(D-aspartate) O-methyltransferase
MQCCSSGSRCFEKTKPIGGIVVYPNTAKRTENAMLDYTHARAKMVDIQVAARGIRDSRVLQAMRKVPREEFVDAGMEEFAYEDGPLPIGEQQTISQPYIVALMLEAAELRSDDVLLEIGTGSGYAAAVASHIVKRVYTIERHASLARVAEGRFRELGYDNIRVQVSDGTLGLPDNAPFDAIIVTAGGPLAPLALKSQLRIGGRLIIPVGDENRRQMLYRITRVSETDYDEDELGGVRFVPLIGEQGWDEDGSRSATSHVPGIVNGKSIPVMIREAAERLPDIEDPAFGEMFDRFADRKIVLLGEASHGTSEFYRARAAITRRLVAEHGFTIVAVEADWPDAAAIDRFIGHRPKRLKTEKPFQRFPTWMWRNTDVDALINWLRQHNASLSREQRVGFYGLDIYNMNASIGVVLEYLDRVDPAAAKIARERYGCLTPWQRDPATYGRAVLTAGYRKCEEAVLSQCRDLLARQVEQAAGDDDTFLDIVQNARLVASAERYYRIMYYGGAESWNLRDTHMFETLQNILKARGPDSKALVWAHNSHLGDARHTEMGAVRGELNVGQLVREYYGDEAALIGFGTHGGTVAAASDWGGEMDVKQVRPSHSESYEQLFHSANVPACLLDFTSERNIAVRRRLQEPRLERFIGVIYRPETELVSHYAEASLPRQFDAFVWFDETTAVTPLPIQQKAGMPETYPFGL